MSAFASFFLYMSDSSMDISPCSAKSRVSGYNNDTPAPDSCTESDAVFLTGHLGLNEILLSFIFTLPCNLSAILFRKIDVHF